MASANINIPDGDKLPSQDKKKSKTIIPQNLEMRTGNPPKSNVPADNTSVTIIIEVRKEDEED